MSQMIEARHLQLADVVNAIDGAFGTAIVKQVTAQAVTFYRPYGQPADFSCTSGVICYVGIEEWSVAADGRLFEVYRRQTLK